MNKSESISKSEVYPNVFSSLAIGNVRLPNRVVFPAWQVNYANSDGTVSDQLMTFHTRLAEGGCGLIFTGCATVTDDGIPFDKVMHLEDEKYIPGVKKLMDRIKSLGAVAGIQLVHYGRQSSTGVSGDVLMAPSAIPCPVMSQFDPQYKVREMTLEDIEHIRESFIAATVRAAEAGAQVVEIHGAHGYLLSEFLSPYSNKRTDMYGGSVENRCRLLEEILQGIRDTLKGKVAVSVRINGNDFVEDGLTPNDYKDIIPILESAGVDLFNVSAGVYESMARMVPGKDLGIAPHADICAQIKEYTSVPVCAVGSILSVETAESLIASGITDLCAMGRAQVADPGIVMKSFQQQQEDIRKCIHCNNCTFWTTGDPQMYCSINPDYKKKK